MLFWSIYKKTHRNLSQNFDQLLFWISQLDYQVEGICERNVFKLLFMFGRIVEIKNFVNLMFLTTQLAPNVLIAPAIAYDVIFNVCNLV